MSMNISYFFKVCFLLINIVDIANILRKIFDTIDLWILQVIASAIRTTDSVLNVYLYITKYTFFSQTSKPNNVVLEICCSNRISLKFFLVFIKEHIIIHNL